MVAREQEAEVGTLQAHAAVSGSGSLRTSSQPGPIVRTSHKQTCLALVLPIVVPEQRS
jgi:hypothetical protein